MKEKLLLVGSGGLGRTVLEHACKNFDCFFVDDAYPIGTEICGVKVIGKLKDLEKLFNNFKSLVITIGDNHLREKLYIKAKTIGFVTPNIIADSAYISPFAIIGDACIFLNNVCIQNGSQIGVGVVLNAGVEIHHDSVVEDYVLIYSNSVTRTYSHICSRVKIGSNTTIKNNTVIVSDTEIADSVAI